MSAGSDVRLNTERIEAEKPHWEVRWHEGHRTVYGFSPHLVCGGGPPGGSATRLEVGFCTEEECQAYIDTTLADAAGSWNDTERLRTALPREWAEDFDGVWHLMASSAWTKGVGPSDSAACCGRQIQSVHHSTFDPWLLDDGTEVVCPQAPTAESVPSPPQPVIVLSVVCAACGASVPSPPAASDLDARLAAAAQDVDAANQRVHAASREAQR